ncbi:MAG TPA: hypothetical protein VL307_09735 [Chitinophagaceae bacterium]|nr:hypothetical protein [Chitinophagaceae bacterium]
MRAFLLIIFCFALLSVKAQQLYPTALSGAAFTVAPVLVDSNRLAKKWSVSSYMGLSSGFMFGNGNRGSFYQLPVGVQLNRRLNNNLFAFAQLSAAPGYLHLNPSFNAAAYNKQFGSGPMFNSQAFGMSTRIAAGLMYVNEDRTFSISGSIGVERSNWQQFSNAGRNRLSGEQVKIQK